MRAGIGRRLARKSKDRALALVHDTLGSSSTDYSSSNSNRKQNVRRGAELINGTVLYPGEEFSVEEAVVPFDEENGYAPAASYEMGNVVETYGGGICQVSTTLYNAVLRSGLKTTRRQSHTFKPTYVTPGFDATISWGGPDYCFANVPADAKYSNSESYAIGIYAKYSDRTVTVSIYGRPVLKDGYTYELESEKIKDIPVVRKLIEPGSDQQPTTGSMGSQWQTYLIVKKDGEQVQRTLDHNTYYSGHVEYYTDQTTVAPTLPSESESLMESQTETVPQIIEGVDGGPGVSGGTGVSGGPGVTGGPGTTTAPTDDHSYPQSTVPSGGPGATSAPTEAQQQIGPGIISDAPGAL